MEPTTAVAVTMGAIEIIKAVLPGIQLAFNAGEITPEQQAALKASIDALRQDTAFIGPEWDVK